MKDRQGSQVEWRSEKHGRLNVNRLLAGSRGFAPVREELRHLYALRTGLNRDAKMGRRKSRLGQNSGVASIRVEAHDGGRRRSGREFAGLGDADADLARSVKEREDSPVVFEVGHRRIAG